MQKLQPFIDSLQGFAQKQLNFERPPKLLLKQDEENSKDVFGQTAFYDPAEESITIFIASRHPKDILRSLAHELVHHTQNLRGDLSPEKCGNMAPGYAQSNDHMRNMEREAYELGNLCFRDWEDGCKKQMQENKNLKENKKMTVKISRKDLKGIITKLLSGRDSTASGRISSIKEVVVKEEKRYKGKSVPDYSHLETRRKAYQQARKDKAPVFFFQKGDRKGYSYYKSGYTAPAFDSVLPQSREAPPREFEPEDKDYLTDLTQDLDQADSMDDAGITSAPAKSPPTSVQDAEDDLLAVTGEETAKAKFARLKGENPDIDFEWHKALSDEGNVETLEDLIARGPGYEATVIAPGEPGNEYDPRLANLNASEDAVLDQAADAIEHTIAKLSKPGPLDEKEVNRMLEDTVAKFKALLAAHSDSWEADAAIGNPTEAEKKINAIVATDPSIESWTLPGLGLSPEDQLVMIQAGQKMAAMEKVSTEKFDTLTAALKAQGSKSRSNIADKSRKIRPARVHGIQESSFQTPESEKALNESMFGKKNNEIFNRLKELWTK